MTLMMAHVQTHDMMALVMLMTDCRINDVFDAYDAFDTVHAFHACGAYELMTLEMLVM